MNTKQVQDKLDSHRIGSLLNVDDCFNLFIVSGEIHYQAQNPDILTDFKALNGSCTKLAVKKDDVEAKDDDKKVEPKTKEAEIIFSAQLKKESKAASDLKEIIVKIKVVHHLIEKHWSISEVQLNASNEIIELDVDQPITPANHSFSCADLELHKSIRIEEQAEFTKLFTKIKLRDFQIQPFDGAVFLDSYDCATWFTIGTFSGFIVLVLFTFILAFGICYIMSIKTNDR